MIVAEQVNSPSIHDLLDVSLDGPQVNCILGATGVGITTMLQGITGEMIGQLKTPDSENQDAKIALICHSSQPNWTIEKICRYIVGRFFASEPQSEFEAPAADDPAVLSAADQLSNHLVFLNGTDSKTSVWDFAGANHDCVLRNKLSDQDHVRGIVIDDLDTIILGVDTDGCDKPYQAHARHLRDYLTWAGNIADEFCCPVWIGHHLKAAVSSSDPQELLSHTDAALWNGMGDLIDRCFVIGNHDETGRFRFDRTKPRDSTAAPGVLRIADGIWFNSVSADAYRDFFAGPINLDQVHVDSQTLKAMHDVAAQYRAIESERIVRQPRLIDLD